jgi:threonylcarbamoyladenosine tRNA methylthiotransferase CDKAL1
MRVFVKSVGCSANLADGEVLAGCLAQAGHTLVDSVMPADVVVYNTCAVKGPTENRVIEALRRVPASKKLVVAGCLPLINFSRLISEVRLDGIVGPAAGDTIIEVVRRVSEGEKKVTLQQAENAKPDLGLPRVQHNPVVSVVSVNYGCLGSCAYCCVVHARGQVRSYRIPEVVARVREDYKRGSREFWITSQDTACYGKDNGTNLAELLKALCGIEGDFKIRVGMMTPNVVMDILEDLVEAFRDEHVFKFVHLPVQSGDDEVLSAMRRFYSAGDFRHIVDAFRREFPDITLSTDVICGFPNESNEAFSNSMRLIEEVKPDIVNVSKFFPRPRTMAAKMIKDFIPSREIKRRSTMMADLARRAALERNKRWVDWAGDVLVDEIGKFPCSWIGRNFAYKPVVLASDVSLLGKKLHVKVVKASLTHLQGEISE